MLPPPPLFKTMKKITLFFILIGFLYSQSGKIAGKVIDKSTGEPLPGASVLIEGLKLGSTTDNNGYFVILDVPPGIYTVKALYLGYKSVSKSGVRVRQDYTTYVDFVLEPSTLKAESVVVVAKKPKIEVGEVSTSQTVTPEEIHALPALTVRKILTTRAGIIPDLTFKGLTLTQAQEQFQGNPSDRVHFRGGRENETAYLLEGVYLNDPIWGGFQLDALPAFALSEMTAYTGTYGPQYGEALSAAVSFSLPVSNKKSFKINGMSDLPESQNTHQIEWLLSYPHKSVSLLFTGKFYTTDGRFYGYIYPRWRDSEGTDKSGTPKKVSMSYKDIFSLIGKVMWRPKGNIKLSLTSFIDTIQTMEYLHFYKYAPYDAPRFWMGDKSFIFSLTHLITSKAFYSVKLFYLQKYYKGGVYDKLDENLREKHLISPDGFAVSGVAYLWKKSLSKTKGVRAYFVKQHGMHEIQIGGEYYDYWVHLERRNPTSKDPTDSIPPYDFTPWELYTRKPRRQAIYFKDKIEFHNIGMVLNGGMRWDRVEPNTYWVKDPKHLATSDVYKVKPKTYLSPRLGVSYPVSDNMAFRFSYGVFHQFPAFFLLYQGLNEHSDVYPRPSFRDIQTAVGNAEMEPERVTSYEVGLQYAPRTFISINVAAFYRDLADMIGKRFISGPDVPAEYYMFDNKGYGTIKGIDLSIRFNREFINGFVNYTYTQVRISDPDVLFFPSIKFYRPVVADWEIPHKFNFAMTYKPRENWSISFSGFYSSGLPYTLGIEPNTERGPSLKQFDLKVERNIRVGRFSGSVFTQIFNVFNIKNVYWVYPATGKAGDDGNPATSPDWDRNPTQYGPGRHIFIGFTLTM